MKSQRMFTGIYAVIAAGVIGVAVLSFQLKNATDRMDAYQEKRYVSSLLADELRQSSDDLTRLARTYVVTGDARYEKMYWDVLAIRNGSKPRPDSYERIYWDFVFDAGDKPRPDTPAVPLRELMERAGFTKAEFDMLSEAQKNSDGLVKTENIAMNMVKGRYDDGSGKFTITGARDPETARRLLHDAAYHRTKASIMKPIDRFQQMLSERTKRETTQSLKNTKSIFWALQSILFGLFLSATLLLILKNRQQELEKELSRSLLAEVEERKRAEEERRESYHRLQTIMDGIREFIYVSDFSTHEILMVNRYVREQFGDISGRICWETMQAGQTGPCAFCTNPLLLTPAGDPADPVVWEFRNTLNNRWYECRDQAIRWTDGRLVRMEVATDITEKKRIQEEKLDLELQIQQAQKMESLGVLAGGVAHDFNNLLMVVLGHADLALKDVSPSSIAHESIREITTAAQRAADLSRQMLTYSGKAVFRMERVNLGGVVEEMAHLVKTAISRKATMEMKVDPDLPSILGDPSQIRQIVMNLIINASEAIGDRSGVITISAGTERCDEEYLRKTELPDHPEPGLYVHLEVTDTGIGMDAQTRSRIFEPFFSTKFTGRGLGLSAVLGIVRAHKGALKVSSEPGSGTTFKVLFPVSKEEGGEGIETPLPDAFSGWRGKGTILLVEDEESLLALGTRMLELLGFSVLTATDGLEAVELYRKRGSGIDLVLMDLTMPRMDGAEAFAELRRLAPDVRVVLVSGFSREDITSRFAGMDLDGVLLKPYTLARLRETVARLLPEPSFPPGSGRPGKNTRAEGGLQEG